MIDVIKEYLVSIGFNVDKQGFDDVQKRLNMFEKLLGDTVKSIGGRLALASAAVAAFSIAATAAIGNFVLAMAKADQQTEIFARRMLTTEKNARSLQSVMKAMGLENLEALKDVSLNPELRQQFLGLRHLAAGLEPNEDVQRGLANMRSIGYELQRIQLVASYFFLNVAGKIAKYLEKPIAHIRASLEWFVQNFSRNIDKWADGLAKVAVVITEIAEFFIRIIAGVGKLLVLIASPIVKFTFQMVKNLSGMLEKLPGTLKLIASAIGLIGIALMTGPWGAFLAAITAVGLLADDYFTYKAGGRSGLPGLWEQVDGFMGILENINKILTDWSQAWAKKYGVDLWGGVKGAGLGAAGAAIGAGIGAAAGSIIPGAGPAAGAAIGAGIGAGVGGFYGSGAHKKQNQKKAKEAAMALPGNVTSNFMTAYSKFLAKHKNKDYAYLQAIAQVENLKITGGWEGGHSKGSLHNVGRAIDFDHRNVSADKIRRLQELYGLRILDERYKGYGKYGYSSGPHFHGSIDPNVRQQKMEQMQRGPVNVVINVTGNGSPHEIAQAAYSQFKDALSIRNLQGVIA